jgi:transposase InsO family protein
MIVYTVQEATVLTEWWRQEYNHLRPHSALGYRPPAPEAIAPLPLRVNSVALSEMPSLT